jgi:hypothetical protein
MKVRVTIIEAEDVTADDVRGIVGSFGHVAQPQLVHEPAAPVIAESESLPATEPRQRRQYKRRTTEHEAEAVAGEPAARGKRLVQITTPTGTELKPMSLEDAAETVSMQAQSLRMLCSPTGQKRCGGRTSKGFRVRWAGTPAAAVAHETRPRGGDALPINPRRLTLGRITAGAGRRSNGGNGLSEDVDRIGIEDDDD